jgi:hypothetical protein
MRCHHCNQGFECCHGLSVRHADGTTECLGDEPCGLAHDLHPWAIECDERACTCRLDDHQSLALPLAA